MDGMVDELEQEKSPLLKSVKSDKEQKGSSFDTDSSQDLERDSNEETKEIFNHTLQKTRTKSDTSLSSLDKVTRQQRW